MVQRHELQLPVIQTLYNLMEVKGRVYMDKKRSITIKHLFREGVSYSKTLHVSMEDQERENIWQLDIYNLNKKNNRLLCYGRKKCTALIAYPSNLETTVDF